jgi:hypothetical protein
MPCIKSYARLLSNEAHRGLAFALLYADFAFAAKFGLCSGWNGGFPAYLSGNSRYLNRGCRDRMSK